ncbi:MAG: ATP-binding protein, partial [Myxococcota bacterium]|nr:ATP-binding protein [Myxococcota bacterium]
MRLYRIPASSTEPAQLASSLATVLPGVEPADLARATQLAQQVASRLSHHVSMEWTMTDDPTALRRATFSVIETIDGRTDDAVTLVVEELEEAGDGPSAEAEIHSANPIASMQIRNGQVWSANAAAKSLFGDLIDDGAPVLGLVPPSEQGTLTAALKTALADPTAAICNRLAIAGGGRATVTATHLPSHEGTLLLTVVNDEEAAREHERSAATDRLATVGRLAAGVAHEINNPMTVVSLNLAALEADLENVKVDANTAGSLKEKLDDAILGAERVTEIVRRLLTFANQSRDSDDQGCPIAAIQLARRLGAFSMPRTVQMDVEVPETLPLALLGTGPLSQVLLNLIINAGDALESSGTESPVVRIRAREVPDFVEIEVIDNGPGVPEDLHHSIFEPFYTSKEPGKGTGLGLAISRRLIEDAGGCLMVLSSDPGACFRIRIPTTVDAPAPGIIDEPAETLGGRLLIIDDEPALRRVLHRLLEDDWCVEEAGDGAQAIQLITDGFQPDAIICDVCMPGMNGQGFINWLEENRPDLVSRLVWLTGGTLDRHALNTVQATDRPMLSKPPRIAEVREALSAAAASEVDPNVDRRAHPYDWRGERASEGSNLRQCGGEGERRRKGRETPLRGEGRRW